MKYSWKKTNEWKKDSLIKKWLIMKVIRKMCILLAILLSMQIKGKFWVKQLCISIFMRLYAIYIAHHHNYKKKNNSYLKVCYTQRWYNILHHSHEWQFQIKLFTLPALSVSLKIHWLYHLKRSKIHLTNRAVLGMTLNCIRWCSVSFGDLGNVEFNFIAVTPRSTLNWSVSICECPIDGSNGSF